MGRERGGELHDGREGGENWQEKCLRIYNQCPALNLPALCGFIPTTGGLIEKTELHIDREFSFMTPFNTKAASPLRQLL